MKAHYLYSLLLLIMIFPGLKAKEKTVVLLGQWHLSSSQKTTNIEASKELPQFANQKSIYLILQEWIEQGKVKTVLAEGCEGEINKNFKAVFNDWSFSSLAKVAKKKDYQDVLTLIPLKIEARYGDKVKTLCVDDYELIKKHQLIFSELRGYTGYFIRLKRSKSNKKIFQKYLQSLNDLEKKKISDPLNYLRIKIQNLLEQEQKLLMQRNISIVNQITAIEDSLLALVIGNRHIEDLKKQLESKSIKAIIPEILAETLPKNDFIQEFKQIIQEKAQK